MRVECFVIFPDLAKADDELHDHRMRTIIHINKYQFSTAEEHYVLQIFCFKCALCSSFPS